MIGRPTRPTTGARATLVLLAAMARPAAPRAGAQPSREALFHEAAEAYARGDHDTAASHYERLIEAGVSDPDVHYDLALAELRRDRFGSAIRHLRIALTLRPGDAEAEATLAAARTALVSARAESEGTAVVQEGAPLLEVLGGSFTEPTLAAATLLLLFASLLARGVRTQLRGNARLAAGVAAALLFPLFALAGAGVLERRGVFRDGPRAGVLVDRVALREGPDERAQVRSEAREGEDAVVLGEDERWRRVRLHDGRQGWAPAEAVGLVDGG